MDLPGRTAQQPTGTGFLLLGLSDLELESIHPKAFLTGKRVENIST